MRLTSIRLHLLLGIGLAAAQLGVLAWVGASASTALSGLVTVALLLLLWRTLALHRDRRQRLLEVLEVVRRGAAGDASARLPAGEDDEAGHVAAAVNRLLETVRERANQVERERDLDRLMVRETPNGLLAIDADGIVRRASPALCRLLECTGDPVGRRPIETIPVPTFQAVIDEAARTREVRERPLSHNGRELLFRAVPAADGTGVLGVVLDLTSVGRTDRLRRDFVANVSHELRTPITAIVGYAEAMEDEREALNEELRPMLDAIRRNADRLRALVEDVLSLSNIEARGQDLPLESQPVQPVVDAVLERFGPAAERRGVRLIAGPPVEAEALLNADALEHALSNLVDNAVKYTPGGGEVRVRVGVDDEGVEVWVEDNGPGIDPIHHPRIFERFYRVDAGRSRAVGGTGLGLALVKHLCSAMKAEIRLVSAAGEGARFGIRLPVPRD